MSPARINRHGEIGGTIREGTTKKLFLWLPRAAYGLGAGLQTLYTSPDTWVAVYDLNDNGNIVWTYGTAPNTDEMSAFVPVPLDVPDAPSLRFRHADPGHLELSWSPATPGITLQSSDSLSPPHWINAPSGPSNPVTVPTTLPTRFYRVIKP